MPSTTVSSPSLSPPHIDTDHDMDAPDGAEPELAEDGDSIFGGSDDDEKSSDPLDQDDNESRDPLAIGDDEMSGLEEEAPGLSGASPEPEPEPEHEIVMSAELGRHFIPHGTDGEVYLLKIPSFIKFDMKSFDVPTFMTDPILDEKILNNRLSKEEYNQILHTVRWWRDKDDPSQLRSNARILRWDTGDLTLQFFHEPENQYLIDAKPLVQPQVNPAVPTPTSVRRPQRDDEDEPQYDPRLDARLYLAAPSLHNEFLCITNHVTASLSIQAGAAEEELAAQQLRASKMKREDSRAGIQMVSVLKNPEHEMRAEMESVREKARLERKRQLESDRLAGRSADVNRKVGGLNATDFSGSSQRALPKKRRAGGKSRGGRGGERLDDSESEGEFRRRTKDDEYDKEDGFIAESDEDEDDGQDGEDDDEAEDEEDEDIDDLEIGGPPAKPPIQSIERDPPGGTRQSPQSKPKRKVIDDDDDE